MSYYRTPEHRALRAQLIQQWKPWEHSTGPRSEAGKAKVSQNAFKGGWRQQFKELRTLLREQDEVLADF
ncbi:MAG: hypothetical protein EBR47_06425 [Betaproteobacteria bacterium]|nr:hypothetical protein [Betaproteobacteria bacterium]